MVRPEARMALACFAVMALCWLLAWLRARC
jgi:hypothetical protein